MKFKARNIILPALLVLFTIVEAYSRAGGAGGAHSSSGGGGGGGFGSGFAIGWLLSSGPGRIILVIKTLANSAVLSPHSLFF